VCPLYARIDSLKRLEPKLAGENFDSSSRTPFVSRFGYPRISVGVLTPPGVSDAWEYDAPRYWSSANYNIPKIVALRSSMVNSRFNADVRTPSKYLATTQEIAMSKRPVSLEVQLKNKPKLRLVLRPELAPTGPSAKLKALTLTQNPRVPRAVERLVNDYDVKSIEAIAELSTRGLDENYLTRLLSVGLLGTKPRRKLVPTRWAITAIDDTLGKQNLAKIKDFKLSEHLAFFGGYLGNYYIVLMLPALFSYELFEMMAKEGEPSYVTDYEGYEGRHSYAENTAGGYYAARLAVTEKLLEMKRQASVIVLRFITDEYSLPLGVWVVREAVRKALASKPIRFSDLELMLNYARIKAQKSFGVNIANLLKRSRLLDVHLHQKNLKMFT